MMILKVLLAISLFTSELFAAEPILFTLPAAVSQDLRPRNFERGVAATFRLTSYQDNCTASWISSKGHFITAMHCLKVCLSLNAFKKTLIQDSTLPLWVRPETLNQKFCPVYMNGYPRNVQIIAMGKGYIPPATMMELSKNEALYDQLREQGYGEQADYVILKLNGLSGPACSPRAALDQGTYVWSMSYPGTTNRRNNHDADGSSVYFSAGQSYERAEDISFIKTANPSGSLNPPGIVWTDLDLMYGTSGAPVMDSEGSLVGLAVAGVGVPQDLSMATTTATQIIPIQDIFDDVAAQISAADAEEIFSCR